MNTEYDGTLDQDKARLLTIARRERAAARQRRASREEQRQRYIDSGPNAWDDTGESPDY